MSQGFIREGLTTIGTGNTLWVDAVFGDNATALPDRMDLPYLTLTAAKTAAGVGDLIYVRPGTYTDYDILKHRVNWYFEPGAVIAATAVSESAIFTDNATAMTSVISGRLSASISALNPSGLTSPVIRLQDPSSNVAISALELSAEDVDAPNNAVTYMVNGGTLSLTCDSLYSGGDTLGFADGGTFYLNCRYGNGPLYAFQNEGGSQNITIDFADVPETIAYCGGAGAPETVIAVGRNPVGATGPCFYYNAGTLSAHGGLMNGLLTSTGPNVVMEVEFDSLVDANLIQAAINSDGGVMSVRGKRMQTVNPIAHISAPATGGNMLVNIDNAISTFAGNGVSMLEFGGGNAKLTLKGRFELTTNNAMSNDWQGDLLLDGATVVVGSGATESFSSSAPLDLIAYGSYTNKDVGADVTPLGSLTVGSYVI